MQISGTPFLCKALSSRESTFWILAISTSPNSDICLLNSARWLYSMWAASLKPVLKCLETEIQSDCQTHNLLLGITVLSWVLYNIWKYLSHVFCPVLSLFMLRGQIWSQSPSPLIMFTPRRGTVGKDKTGHHQNQFKWASCTRHQHSQDNGADPPCPTHSYSS